MPEEKVSLLTEWDFDMPRDNRFHDPLPPAADAGPRQPSTGPCPCMISDSGQVYRQHQPDCPKLAAAPPVLPEPAPPSPDVPERLWCSYPDCPCDREYEGVCQYKRSANSNFGKVINKAATAPDWAMRVAREIHIPSCQECQSKFRSGPTAACIKEIHRVAALIREAGRERERLASATALQFIEGKLVAPFLHGDQEHQDWLREETRKWIPELAELISGRELKLREALRIAAIFAPHNHPFVGDITPGCPKCEASRLLGGESK